MDNYHITKNGVQWSFQKEGAGRAINNSETKAEAIEKMREFMSNKEGSVKIHKENGLIQEERTYPRSKDPSNTPG